MESNFSHELLEELKKSGVDVELIAEYTKLYRQHVKELLHSGIKRQSELVKVKSTVSANYVDIYS